jgi:hypothetical protein
MSDLEAKLDEQISVLSCQKPTTPAEVRFELDATSCVPPPVYLLSDLYNRSTCPAARKDYWEGEDNEVHQQDH